MQPTPISSDVSERDQRVRFKHPVRVVPIGGPPRAYRVLAGNLSRRGMFLKMPTPFDAGTRVALSLEAGGRVLPFAQGEVVWRNLEDKVHGLRSGFGVRFTGFLHPRAHELVDYLVENLESGKPLVAPGKPSPWPRRLAWIGAGLAACVFGAALTTAVLRWMHEVPEPASISEAIEEEAPVAGPAKRAEAPVVVESGVMRAAPLPAMIAIAPTRQEVAREQAAEAAKAESGPAKVAAPAEPERAPAIAEAPAAPTPAEAKEIEADRGGAAVAAPARAVAVEAKPAPIQPPVVEEAVKRAQTPPAEVKAAPAIEEQAPSALKPARTPAAEVKAAKPSGASAVDAAFAKAPAPPKVAKPAKATDAAADDARTMKIPSGAVRAITPVLTGDRLVLTLTLAPGATITRAFVLTGPDRIAIDVSGAEPDKSQHVAGSGEISRVRAGRVGGGTRVVIDVTRALGKLQTGRNTVAVTLGKAR